MKPHRIGTAIDRGTAFPASALAASVLLSLLTLLPARLLPARSAWGQSIEILTAPTVGQAGQITGVVNGFDPATHDVAAFIYQDGRGWFSEPSSTSRITPIQPDGTFTVDVGVNGEAEFATAFGASVVPKGSFIPGCSFCLSIPIPEDSLSLDVLQRYGRNVEFAGYNWGIKESGGATGPGQNRFSARPEDIFVDSEGALHLTINNSDGSWTSTEAVLTENLGYGTYAFKTNSEVDKLDPNAVFGAFTWDFYGDDLVEIPGWPFREIDFEDSRWGDASDPNTSQTVIQPPGAGRLERYALPDLSGDARLTRFFTWAPGYVEWVTLLGDHDPTNFPESAVINRRILVDQGDFLTAVPTPSNENFRFNLWLFGGPPSDGQRIEVVITDFQFIPIPEPATCGIVLLGLAGQFASRPRRKGCGPK